MPLSSASSHENVQIARLPAYLTTLVKQFARKPVYPGRGREGQVHMDWRWTGQTSHPHGEPSENGAVKVSRHLRVYTFH